MADKPTIPPIFEQNPGLRFVGVGTSAAGTPYLKFSSLHPSGVQQVICYIHCKSTEPLIYSYSVRRGQLVEEFLGPNGDPEKDLCTPMAVIDGHQL